MRNENHALGLLRSSSAWQFSRSDFDHSVVVDTPVVSAPELARLAGVRQVYFKAEYLQKGGSFKIRGAMHKLRSLINRKPRPDVYTASAGNHGIGLSIAAKELDFNAIIYVPISAPEVKIKKFLRPVAKSKLLEKIMMNVRCWPLQPVKKPMQSMFPALMMSS